MSSSLTVVTPATCRDLTVLATVKDDAGIVGTSEDTRLARWITQASRMAESYCRRVFALETVTETFWPDDPWGRLCQSCLYLQRTPIVSASVVITEDGTTRDVSDYRLDAETGALYRLSSGAPTHWAASTAIVVTYDGGYELLDSLPEDIERAVINMIRDFRADSTRDPNLIEKETVGVSRYRWWAPGEAKTALPIEISGLLDPYVRRWGYMR